jgi:peptidoglycan hydrolase CwlO-like protein
MSDFADDTYEDDYEQQASETNPVRARMKQLEKAVREKDALLAKYAETEKKMTFMEAGINTSDPKFKYFVKGYDGEMTPEAITQAAVEAQLITPQASPADVDKAAWQQTNRIAAGAETASAGPSWVKRIRDASSADELSAIFAEAQAQGVDLGEM